MTFNDFNFKDELIKAIREAGFREPSPVQKEAMPIVMQGRDIVAQAHTGTGKTAAFALPVLNMLKLDNSVEMVVIVPTRELATQVSDEIYKFGKFLGVRTATIYGGSSYSRQIKHVENANIVVATPGRFLDLLSSKKIDVNPSFVVLDEADEMLDMGFLDDIKKIFNFFKNHERQTLMFSATMPKPIKELANKILKDPATVKITQQNVTNAKITQNFYVVKESERDDALIRLIDYKDPKKAIVFCRTRKETDRIAMLLSSKGYVAAGLHGDMSQREREDVIKAFKKDTLEILIATDVAARGLDVNNVSHVFNYHLPFDSESYVHRIGRTGRAGKDGEAISIVTPSEFKALKNIQSSVGSNLEAKVIPTINDVYMKQKDALLAQIKEQQINKSAKELVAKLLEDGQSIDNIALKLASMIFSQNDIEGSNKIGLNIVQIQELMEKAKHSRGDNRKRNGRSRNRRNQDRNRSRNRNRSGNRKQKAASY
jgi:ATP-dependent RNA helicase DeaD